MLTFGKMPDRNVTVTVVSEKKPEDAAGKIANLSTALFPLLAIFIKLTCKQITSNVEQYRDYEINTIISCRSMTK